MVKIKLSWIEKKNCSKIVDVPFNEELFKIEMGKEGLDIINDTYNLRESISDYFNWNRDDNFLYGLLTDDEQENYYEDLECEEILEIDKLVVELSHLIVPKKLNSCYNSQTGNYCSHCGTKLN